MSLKVLADTSVWIEYFNLPDSPVGERLGKLILEGAVYITGVVLTEILQGARDKEEYRELQDLLGALPQLESTGETYLRAGCLCYQLRRKGITIPLTDCLIAAVSLENGCSVFTLDPHFKCIPELTLY